MTLLGNPTATAERVTPALFDAYSEWLFMEGQLPCRERWAGNPDAESFVPANTGASAFHFPAWPADRRDAPQPSTRAAAVLAAVGCGWREGD